MIESSTKATERTGELLTAQQAGAMLGVSTRHLRRMADAGNAPRPVRIGGAVRWRRAELTSWIDAGCPSRWEGGAR